MLLLRCPAVTWTPPPAGPTGTYNPDPINPAARMYGQNSKTGNSNSIRVASYDDDDDHAAPEDLVAARPNFKPCVPCGDGYSTSHTQSTSRADCLADCPCGTLSEVGDAGSCSQHSARAFHIRALGALTRLCALCWCHVIDGVSCVQVSAPSAPTLTSVSSPPLAPGRPAALLVTLTQGSGSAPAAGL